MKWSLQARERATVGKAGAFLALAAIACSGKILDSQETTTTSTGDVVPAVNEGVTSTTNPVDEVDGAQPTPREEVDATARCISDYPSSDPFDAGGALRPDSTTGEMTRPTLEGIVAECELDRGTGCGSNFISKEAALCIAESDQFAPGIRPWTVGLGYHYGYHRILWSVSNVLQDRGADGASGSALSLNAVDGFVVARLDWEAIP